MKVGIALIVTMALLLTLLGGCSNKEASTVATDASTPTAGALDAYFDNTDQEMFTDRDSRTEYDVHSAITVSLNGSTATASSNSVIISGSTVQLTQEATYLISGTLDDGMLIVSATDSDKLQLVFDGVHITSSTCAALYIQEADKVFITLAEGSVNSLTNGGSFTAIDDSNIDAALFSKQDLTINGAGSLTVSSPAGHGIVCKDDLVITGGSLKVNAASHSLDANDSVRLTGTTLDLHAGKDGIHCENSDDSELGYIYISGGNLTIEAQGDGISAGSYLHITGGTFDILAGGGSENGDKQSSDNWGGYMGGGGGGRPGDRHDSTFAYTTDTDSSSMKGFKSGDSMLITAGTVNVNSADDALHSNQTLTVNGGTFQIATGDDALHAEDTLSIGGGTIRISESYEGLEALHIFVTDGDINLVASDDGLNAAGGTDSSGYGGGRDGMYGGGPGMMSGNSDGSIVISGGKLYINASGDGIDANGTLEISGGHVTVVGPTQGDTATLDYDVSATITGGTFIGTGASNMAQTFSSSTQGVLALSVGSQAAGTQITLKDASGNTVVSYAPELSYQVVILSTPDMVAGESYTITVGSQSGEFQAS